MINLSMILAVGPKGEVGKENKLPWHLPGDLRFFRDTTIGHPIVMGWNTWESLGEPLEGRPHVVVTSKTGLPEIQGVTYVISFMEALAVAEKIAEELEVEEIFFIGGVKIWETALPIVNRLYITRVEQEVEADTFFDLSLLGDKLHDDWRVYHKTFFDLEGVVPKYTISAYKIEHFPPHLQPRSNR